MCNGAFVEVREQLGGVASLLALWALGIRLRLPCLYDKSLYPLSNFAGPYSYFDVCFVS